MAASRGAAADHRSSLKRTLSPGLGSVAAMDEWIRLLLFVAAWFALQRWLLPRLGVPT